MSIAINIILILISLVLIIAVLMQEGNKQGLGAIGGAAETFMGKNKSKSYEGKLLTITKIGAAVFVVIAILATWLNARTYTVRYFVDGDEYLPVGEVAKYKNGAKISDYGTPYRVGYNGHWDTELPETMDRTNYELNAVYEIGEYTLTFKNGFIMVPAPDEWNDTVATEGEATASEVTPSEATASEATASEAPQSEAQPKMIKDMQQPEDLGTYKSLYNEPIDMTQIPALPELEGYIVSWDKEIPETMPGVDTTYTVLYTLIDESKDDDNVVDATDGEADAADPNENLAVTAPVEDTTTAEEINEGSVEDDVTAPVENATTAEPDVAE